MELDEIKTLQYGDELMIFGTPYIFIEKHRLKFRRPEVYLVFDVHRGIYDMCSIEFISEAERVKK